MADRAHQAAGSTVDQAEVERFSALAEEWWDPRGKMAPLHKFNPVRLGYIRDRAAEHFGRDPKKLDCLKGLRVLDIGCGGGLLSEPLARLGASMVGVDPSERNVEVAKLHAEQSDLQIAYRSSTAEQLSADGEKFDLVLAMEVVEHVADRYRETPDSAIAADLDQAERGLVSARRAIERAMGVFDKR